MVIRTNLEAMNANRQFNINSGKRAKQTERLSSGFRINRAADDAAGLAISEKMRRQIHGLTQASRNAQDGISLVQIADGAMAEVHDMLNRCTTLSVQAANGTLSSEDRAYLQEEVNAILEEIDQIREKATFNEIPVLAGSETEGIPTSGGGVNVGGLPGWVGGDALAAGYKTDTYTDSSNEKYAAAIVDFSALTAANVDELDGNGFNTKCATCDDHYSVAFTKDKATGTKETSGRNYIYYVNINGVTDGRELVDRIVSAMGANPNSHYDHFTKDGDKLIVYDERKEYEASGSWGRKSSTLEKGVTYDADKLPTPTKPDIKLQVGAESGQIIGIKLPNISTKALGIAGVSIRTEAAAQKAIASFKSAHGVVSRERSNMGAYQNRLEHTIKNLDNIVENTTAAESEIRDTDMAKMMVEFANSSILEQVGTSVLARANQSKQNILSLLS